MIRYKLVTRNRKSLIAHLPNMPGWYSAGECWRNILPTEIFPYPETDMHSFIRTYEKGTTVTAHPQSIGLLVFKRRKDAVKFVHNAPLYKDAIIIRVDCKGTGKIVRTLLADTPLHGLGKLSKHLDTYGTVERAILYLRHAPFSIMAAPDGTMAYQSLVVLD